VKIYVAAVQALRKKETQDETQFTTKIGGKTSLGPSYFILYNFHSQLCVWCANFCGAFGDVFLSS